MREDKRNGDLHSVRIVHVDAGLRLGRPEPVPPVPMEWGTSREMSDLPE